jgi:hypothetical protein
MLALVAGIHVLGLGKESVDGRDKPGHDEKVGLPNLNLPKGRNRIAPNRILAHIFGVASMTT